MAQSSEVSVARSASVFDALEVLALDERFDFLLDHRDFGFELRGKLGDGFVEQEGVCEVFALPVSGWSVCVREMEKVLMNTGIARTS